MQMHAVLDRKVSPLTADKWLYREMTIRYADVCYRIRKVVPVDR